MKNITIVDARMGRGKSSAAIRYMNERKGEKCFLYITPYLAEVERVCERCDFEEPNCDFTSKSIQLKQMLAKRKNIASTHSLFSLMDEEALVLAKENGYGLIVDESLNVMDGAKVTNRDLNIMLQAPLISIDENGSVSWLDSEYEGKFDGYKKMAEDGTLYFKSKTMYEVMNPDKFKAFDEIYILTYLFDGQAQKAYLDYYGFDYRIVGVEQDENGYYFSDRPDCPPPIDYSGLIHIIGVDDKADGKMNLIGNDRTALSKSWFESRWKNHADIKALRKNLRNFFETKTHSRSKDRIWTSFKDAEGWLLGGGNRYATSFLPMNSRATNAYRGATCVAYLTNRFIDPNVSKFFSSKDITIDPQQFALSEMLQFIWRSAIRDGKEIQLYIPSKRMRNLLLNWIKETNGGR